MDILGDSLRNSLNDMLCKEVDSWFLGNWFFSYHLKSQIKYILDENEYIAMDLYFKKIIGDINTEAYIDWSKKQRLCYGESDGRTYHFYYKDKQIYKTIFEEVPCWQHAFDWQDRYKKTKPLF